MVGVDEVGRGCLAGAVVACCLYIKAEIPLELLAIINDSKKLTVKKREYIVQQVIAYVEYEIAEVSVEVIDNINILQAALMAMQNATRQLQSKIEIDHILIDGNKSFPYDKPTHTIVGGDSKSYSIALASIFAKVYRDNLMLNLSKDYPHYLWHKNAGYGTKAHLEAIKSYGITKHHRRSFGIVKQYVDLP